MLPRVRFCFSLLILVTVFAAPATSESLHDGAVPVLVGDGLGKGTIALDGPWQFHLGDDPKWAGPEVDDATGHDGWEQLTADKPWGLQSHPNTIGYGWYRRHVSLSPAPGGAANFELLVPAIDDIYEIYWNGRLVGQLGTMPPHLVWYKGVPEQIYSLGPARSGVLAVRVYKFPWGSNDDGTAGGFEAVPQVGSPEAIAAVKGAMDFQWLRGMQFRFALTSLYCLVALFSFFVWFRNREDRLLLWTGVYALAVTMEMPLVFLRLHLPFAVTEVGRLVETGVREIALWLLLLCLLRMENSAKLARYIRASVVFVFAANTIDALLVPLFPGWLSVRSYEVADAILTAIYMPPQLGVVVILVVAFFLGQRVDSTRGVVAALAFLNSLIYFILNLTTQGSRFTHWTIGDRMDAPFLTFFGSPIGLRLILRTLMFLSIVYAVVRAGIESRRRQGALELEFQNARELQQVLIPEEQPETPGYVLTSAYKPALEVGGDFFQVIPVGAGETLIVLGDVSGKGLKAAMAVSLIVGMARALGPLIADPGKLLSEMNERLAGRLQGGFATAVAVRLSAEGVCTLASAGHLPPYVNEREVEVPGNLPLGLALGTVYECVEFRLSERDRLAVFTDGLLEARNSGGELYGFERVRALFARRPDAQAAMTAAVEFGQDDDITVLTVQRVVAA